MRRKRTDAKGDSQAPDPGPLVPAGGTLRDVPAMHEPGRRRDTSATFDRGVGLDGYDRHTGVDVPTHPVLRLPGQDQPIASPFDEDPADVGGGDPGKGSHEGPVERRERDA